MNAPRRRQRAKFLSQPGIGTGIVDHHHGPRHRRRGVQHRRDAGHGLRPATVDRNDDVHPCRHPGLGLPRRWLVHRHGDRRQTGGQHPSPCLAILRRPENPCHRRPVRPPDRTALQGNARGGDPQASRRQSAVAEVEVKGPAHGRHDPLSRPFVDHSHGHIPAGTAGPPNPAGQPGSRQRHLSFDRPAPGSFGGCGAYRRSQERDLSEEQRDRLPAPSGRHRQSEARQKRIGAPCSDPETLQKGGGQLAVGKERSVRDARDPQRQARTAADPHGTNDAHGVRGDFIQSHPSRNRAGVNRLIRQPGQNRRPANRQPAEQTFDKSCGSSRLSGQEPGRRERHFRLGPRTHGQGCVKMRNRLVRPTGGDQQGAEKRGQRRIIGRDTSGAPGIAQSRRPIACGRRRAGPMPPALCDGSPEHRGEYGQAPRPR